MQIKFYTNHFDQRLSVPDKYDREDIYYFIDELSEDEEI
jgi:hypothetical protein